MLCTRCHGWEVLDGDDFCSWCGTTYLQFEIALDHATVSAADYPPPIELTVANRSPSRPLALSGIATTATWVTPLPGQPLPQTVPPLEQRLFYFDADTLSAPPGGAAEIALELAHGGTATVTLRLLQTEP